MSGSKTAAAAKTARLEIFTGRFALSQALKIKFKSLAKTISEGEKKTLDVNLIFIGDARMRQLNHRFRQKNKTTDVLSFPLETNGKMIEGEIYISLQQAKRQAPLFGNTPDGELLRLTAHGLLHLSGYDHQTEKEKKAMFDREEKYLSGFKAAAKRGESC